MASSISARPRKSCGSHVFAEYIANLLANESSAEEDLGDLFTADDLADELQHNEEENCDGTDTIVDQPDEGLLEQNLTDPSEETLPGSTLLLHHRKAHEDRTVW